MRTGNRRRPAITVVGDTVFDVDWSGVVRRCAPDNGAPVIEDVTVSERPGGAALAALHAARAGADVTLVTALSADGVLDGRLDELTVIDLGLDGPTPRKVRVATGEQFVARIDVDCQPPGDVRGWTTAASAAVAGADAVLVSCYGRGVSARLVESDRHHPLTVWDPHPNGPRPPSWVRLATPNLDEARLAAGRSPSARRPPLLDALDLGAALVERWGASVAVTAGDQGAALCEAGAWPVAIGADAVDGDPCGAGDAFAAELTVGLATGGSLVESMEAAVDAASRWVAVGWQADGGAASLVQRDGGLARAVALADAARARGDVVVAAGGCFDLLHVGHAELLERAASLGDLLVVCVNSDRSISAVKGPSRPVVPAADRARMLRSLAAVDAVVVFDELTPEATLSALRPDVFVKGGDYRTAELPEAAVLAGWGGQVVCTPTVHGRSSSALITAARRTG